MSQKLLIHNARIVSGTAKPHTGWLLTDGELIAEMGKGHPQSHCFAEATEVVDAQGALLLPGAIDDHVHFRDPGLTHKGDMATESAAAVAGGVTSFMDMPNTLPPTVDLDAWEAKMAHAAQVSRANYACWIGATNSNLGTLLAADYRRTPGVKLFMGSSTGNMLVDDDSTLHRIFSQVRAIIAVHAEDSARIAAHTAVAREVFGAEPVPIEMHPLIRDTRACFDCSLRAIELARRYDARLHLLHVSTAAEVRLLQSSNRPKGLTAETCVQYLQFCDKDYDTMGARLKCNPAVKSQTDRNALRRAVADGTINLIATDHAPHLLSEKEGDALTAPSGLPNLQFSLPLLLDLFKPDVVAQRTAVAPARIFGIEHRGQLHPGYYADMVMVEEGEFAITDDQCLGRCGWTPAAGLTTQHRVVTTWVNGSVAYHRGALAATRGPIHPLTFNN
jgi:dihydroorotase